MSNVVKDYITQILRFQEEKIQESEAQIILNSHFFNYCKSLESRIDRLERVLNLGPLPEEKEPQEEVPNNAG